MVFTFKELNNIGAHTPQRSSKRDKENLLLNQSLVTDKNLQIEIDKIDLPRETLYMIDKIIRQRARKGPFGADYSFLVNENQLIEEKDIRIQRMVDGLS